MKQITWDFSRIGVSQGVVAFVISVIKTGIAAGLVAVGAKLASYSITGSAQHVEILTSLIVIVRALISGSVTWLNTSSTVVATPAVEATVENPTPTLG